MMGNCVQQGVRISARHKRQRVMSVSEYETVSDRVLQSHQQINPDMTSSTARAKNGNGTCWHQLHFPMFATWDNVLPADRFASASGKSICSLPATGNDANSVGFVWYIFNTGTEKCGIIIFYNHPLISAANFGLVRVRTTVYFFWFLGNE